MAVQTDTTFTAWSEKHPTDWTVADCMAAVVGSGGNFHLFGDTKLIITPVEVLSHEMKVALRRHKPEIVQTLRVIGY